MDANQRAIGARFPTPPICQVTNDYPNQSGRGEPNPGPASVTLSLQREHSPVIPTLIIDRSLLFREGVERILAESQFRVKASYSSLRDLSESGVIDKDYAALITLDQDAPYVLSSVASLVSQGLRIVLLGEQVSAQELCAAIKAGASGYLMKNEVSADFLLRTLELAMIGAVVLPAIIVKTANDWASLQRDAVPVNLHSVSKNGQPQPASSGLQSDYSSQLSKKEKLVVELLRQGFSNKLIARQLNISEATVKVHVKNILRKLRVGNRTQAAIWAMDRIRSVSPEEVA